MVVLIKQQTIELQVFQNPVTSLSHFYKGLFGVLFLCKLFSIFTYNNIENKSPGFFYVIYFSYIITNKNREDKITDDTSSTKINYYKDNYWQIENIAKPLKAITSYAKDELLTIIQKLDIKDMTIKKTKKEMYEKIL